MQDEKDESGKAARQAAAKHAVLIIALALITSMMAAGTLALGVAIGSSEIAYTPDQAAPFNYYIVNRGGDNITFRVEITGDLANYSHLDQDNYWYSTRRDQMSAFLAREIDLRNVSSATLKFYTKYSIEYGWDFGYVQISTDNGTNWSQLAGTTTTTYRDPGAIVGIDGAPAYTGAVADWTLETMDLTPYAGNLTLLRFWYVTDTGWAEHGWEIDDITVPEIGFTDNVESAVTTWTATNWLKDVVQITDNSTMLSLSTSFTIPDNYTADTANGTQSKLVVTQISGVESAWNPTQDSVPQIIVLLPTLRRIEPAAPQPSGGGGGGGGIEQSYSYTEDELRYYVTMLYANAVKTITPAQLHTPIQTLTIQTWSTVSNVILTLKMLDAPPTEIKQALRDVYAYFEIDAPRLEQNGIKNAVITFRLPKSWVDSRTKDPANVVVSRWDGAAWQDILTNLISKSAEEYTYEAKTQSFSVFAIRIGGKIEQIPIKPVPTQKATLDKIPPIVIIGGNDTNTTERVMRLIEQKTRRVGQDSARPANMEAPTSPMRKMLISAAAAFILGAASLLIIRTIRRKKDGGALLLHKTGHTVQAGEDKHAGHRHEHRSVHRGRGVQPKTAGHRHKTAHRER